MQEWVSSPAGNRSLLLRPILPVNSMTMTYHFASANHTDANRRPRLVVIFSGGWAYNLDRQPAPEAIPPGNQVWRSYYQAAGAWRHLHARRSAAQV